LAACAAPRRCCASPGALPSAVVHNDRHEARRGLMRTRPASNRPRFPDVGDAVIRIGDGRGAGLDLGRDALAAARGHQAAPGATDCRGAGGVRAAFASCSGGAAHCNSCCRRGGNCECRRTSRRGSRGPTRTRHGKGGQPIARAASSSIGFAADAGASRGSVVATSGCDRAPASDAGPAGRSSCARRLRRHGSLRRGRARARDDHAGRAAPFHAGPRARPRARSGHRHAGAASGVELIGGAR